MTRAAPPIGLTMGEPAGIGGEISLKAWLRRREGVPPFALIDDPDRLRVLVKRLGLDVPIREIDSLAEASNVFEEALPVVPLSLSKQVEPGNPSPANAAAVLASIERAVDHAIRGEAAAVVTNPIHKKVLYEAGFRHPGHTEYLAALAGSGYTPVMMLACAELRVVPVTVHIPLRQVADALTSGPVVGCGVVTADALRRDFGIAEPRLAVAGLNPHAGEDGALGHEERDIIAPAITTLRERGIDARGPFPADTLFHPAARAAADAVLCMYHDQALIPLKTVDFDRGVNVTLGLPFVRTSPDHGTGFAIAGTGRANPESLIASLRMALAMASRRAGADATADG